MPACLIGLGSNLDRPARNLELATQQLHRLRDTRVRRVSRALSTAPIGGPAEQASFLNSAALLETSLTVDALLAELQSIEREMGRQRKVRWGPRRIDLDILLYGDEIRETEYLQVPHAWMAARRFVLEPAAEIASEVLHPRIGWTIRQLLDNLNSASPHLAITGHKSVNTSDLAVWLAAATSSKLQLAPRQWRRDSRRLSSGRFVDEAIELLHQAAQVCGTDSMDGQGLRISDYWCGEAIPEVRARCSAHDIERFEAVERRLKTTLAAPTLVVVLAKPHEASGQAWLEKESAEVSDQCFREVLSEVQRYGRGPWLELQTNDLDRTRHELWAAVSAMR